MKYISLGNKTIWNFALGKIFWKRLVERLVVIEWIWVQFQKLLKFWESTFSKFCPYTFAKRGRTIDIFAYVPNMVPKEFQMMIAHLEKWLEWISIPNLWNSIIPIKSISSLSQNRPKGYAKVHVKITWANHTVSSNISHQNTFACIKF